LATKVAQRSFCESPAGDGDTPPFQPVAKSRPTFKSVTPVCVSILWVEPLAAPKNKFCHGMTKLFRALSDIPIVARLLAAGRRFDD